MRQFKIERRDPRIDMSLPVRLIATDVSGAALDQEVMTINISRQGALLSGIRGRLRMGSNISLARQHETGRISGGVGRGREFGAD